MADQRDSGWILVLTAVAVIATQAAAVAISAATSVQTRWPLGLEAVRTHPFQWSIAFTVLIVAAGSAAWWLQQRSGRRADELRPPVIETPEWVVKRPEEVNRVVAALRRRDGGTVGITTTRDGAGGFGKTTLATMVCADRRVWRRFSGWIYLVPVGRDVQRKEAIAAKVNYVIKLMTGEDRASPDPDEAGRQLGSLLDAGPRRLLVLDDVWHAEQLAPFLKGGRRCTRLVTTRMPALLAGRGEAVPVDEMSLEQARQLLTQGLPQMAPTVEDGLLAATGRWPLLLRLVNKILKNVAKTELDVSRTGAELCGRLQTGGAGAVDVLIGATSRDLKIDVPEERARAVRTMMAASTSLLDKQEASRFYELAVFAEDEAIPFDLIAKLWHATAGLEMLQVRQLCARLDELALVAASTSGGGAVSLHDVVHDFLRRELGSRWLAALHGALLDAVAEDLPTVNPLSTGDRGPMCSAWWSLPATAEYLWRYLTYHLTKAGRTHELIELVIDPRWVIGKLQRLGAVAVTQDVALADGSTATSLSRFLDQTAHLLTPTQPAHAVVSILASRLNGYPELQELRETALRETAAVPRLVNRISQPDLPDPALRQTLARPFALTHSNTLRPTLLWEWMPPKVSGCAFAPDGTWLAFNDAFGSVRIWDASSGRITPVLEGQQGWLKDHRSISPDGRWIAVYGMGGVVRVLGTITWQLSSTLQNGRIHFIDGVFSSDSRWLATVSERQVFIWDTRTWQIAARPRGVRSSIVCCGFSANSHWFAVLGSGGMGTVWEVGAWRRRGRWRFRMRILYEELVPLSATLPTHTGIVTIGMRDQKPLYQTGVTISKKPAGRIVGISPDGFVTTCWPRDHRGSLWYPDDPLDALDDKNSLHVAFADMCLWKLSGPLTLGGDGTWAATRTEQGIHIWSIPDLKSCGFIETDSIVTGLVASPDGEIIASTSTDGSVLLWNRIAAQLATEEPRNHPLLADVVAAPDGSWFATATDDSITVHHGAEKKVLVDLPDIITDHSRPDKKSYVSIAPTPTWLATFGAQGVTIHDPLTGRIHLDSRDGRRVTDFAVGSDSTWIATVGEDGVIVRDTTTGKIRVQLPNENPDKDERPIWKVAVAAHSTNYAGHPGYAHHRIVASPEGGWLAVSTRDGVQFWDTSTWQITHSVHSKNRRILLDATADGRRLVCVDPTLTFRFLDTATGQTLAYARGVWPLPWAFIAQWIRNAAKPDVRWMRLAVTITSRIRDSSLARRTAHIVAEILEYLFSIKSLRWPGGVVTSSYGDWLAVGFLGATACVLHTGTGRMLAALDYDFRVGGVAFVAHGRWLVTATEGQVQVWDTATWRIKPTPQLSHLRVTTWAVNPAGTLLAAGLLEGTISIFETTTWRCVTEMRIDDWLRRRACEWLTESLLRIHGGRGLYLFTYETPDPECPQG